MTTLTDDLRDVHPGRQRIGISLAALATLPGIALQLTELARPDGAAPVLPHPFEAIVFGLGIVGAAFLLSWAAEAAQLDISAGLATAILALIAVLPEYAVDFVLAWQGGRSYAVDPSCPPLVGRGTESPCDLALANMTGANRLLIGVGWTMVVFVAFYRLRKTGRLARKAPWEGVRLDRERSIEIAFLALATAYSLTLPLKSTVTLVDAAILVAIFVAYSIRISRAPSEEPHLVGPARYIGGFTKRRRRASVAAMMAFAAFVILIVAEPFAHALRETGAEFGISEFLLIQWLAPLASEAPELLIAGLFAWRLNTNAALGTLVSSKVNQWTLLVGTLPIVFAVASGTLHGLPIAAVQREEVLLTAAQSFFALAVLLNLSMSLREALFLTVLFWSQFILGGVVPESVHGIERITVSVIYMAIGTYLFIRQRGILPRVMRDGFRASYQELSAPLDVAPPKGVATQISGVD
jgi:cation:H+ antiporter